MKRSQIMVAAVSMFAAAAAVVPAGMSSGAVDSSSEVPSFQEFRATSHVDTDGQYIVNGDEAMMSDGVSQAVLRPHGRLEGRAARRRRTASSSTGSTARTTSGRASQAMNLTYCVSTKFGANYTAVVNAMTQGAGLWEAASSKVNFVYVPSADANCTTRNNAVLFSVEPTTTTQYIARAFFPSSPDRSRNVLVNATSLQTSGSWTPGDILGPRARPHPRASGTSTPAPRPAPASRTTTGAR